MASLGCCGTLLRYDGSRRLGTLRGLRASDYSRARGLTTYEIARFLGRHPVIMTRVAETDLAIRSGLYDFDAVHGLWNFPGTIPPWGVQVLADYEFENVTIYPRPDRWYYSAFVPENAELEKVYESPDDGTGAGTAIEDWLSGAANLSKLLLVAGVVVIGVALTSRSKK